MNERVEYSYSRGQAMGLAMGILFVYPLYTAGIWFFLGWWALAAYPVMTMLAVWSTNRAARKRAEFWARDRV